MADFSGDKTMIEAFRLGQDVHASTASKVFRVPLDQVDGEMRRKAKTVNFGIIYGISAFGLAQRIGISRKEATEIIDTYFQEFPSVKAFMDDSINRARELEYAETLLKRRRYLRDINSRNATLRGYTERNAINAPHPGDGRRHHQKGDDTHPRLAGKERLGTQMILQVHDELVFRCRARRSGLHHPQNPRIDDHRPAAAPRRTAGSGGRHGRRLAQGALKTALW